jgi:ABC-2 type transport system permease protein
MIAFIAFTKKEMLESIRTFKFYILAVVFLLFGFMNPVIAKIMPDLLQSLLPEGMTITLTPPTTLDSWAQFFKNGSQIGVIILVVIFSGLMANEFSRGTLVNMLTKGLSRSTVIIAKMVAATIQWTISYLLCVGVTYLYTAYFWSMQGIENLFLSLFGLWLFGTLLITLVIIGGVIFNNLYGSLLFTGGLVILMTVINIFPKFKPFNPITLSTQNLSLLSSAGNNSDFITSMGVTIISILIILFLSVVIFNKKQI